MVSRSDLEDILEDIESVSRRLRRVLREMEGMDLRGGLSDAYDELESAYTLVVRAIQQITDYLDYME